MAGSAAITFPIDASLDTAGTPQSGTGQMALLTGENAAQSFGRHFGPWTPVALRPMLEERSLFRRALDAGHATTFANAYPRSWPGERSARRVAAPPLAARAAGLLTRHQEALKEGKAIASEIVNDGWRAHLGFLDLPVISARAAGLNLGRLAAAARLTFFAHYTTDTAGHRGGMDGAVAALERVDEFLGGMLETLPDDALLMIASDHGNIEDVSTGHTNNPVLGVLSGRGALERRPEIQSLVDVTPAVLRWLE